MDCSKLRRFWYVNVLRYRTDYLNEASRLYKGWFSVEQRFYGVNFHISDLRAPTRFFKCAFVDCSFQSLDMKIDSCTFIRSQPYRCVITETGPNRFDKYSQPKESISYA